jgi:hypothetical protein
LVSGARGYNDEMLLLSDYQYAFRILPLCSIIALILAFFVKETNCKPLRTP